MFSTAGTDIRTVRAAVAAVADNCAVSADVTVVAPAVVAYAVLTLAAVGAQGAGTVGALFTTLRTDIRTVVTAPAAGTDDGAGAAGVAV